MFNLTKSFFTVPFTEQVEYFIIPALTKEEFHHGTWTAILNEAIHKSEDKQNLVNSNSSASWLLYSFLKLFNHSTKTTGKNISYVAEHSK